MHFLIPQELLFDQFRSKEVIADRQSMEISAYTKKVNRCVKSDNFNGAIDWFYTMKEAGVKPNAVTYNCIMNLYSRRGRPETVFKLFEEMQSKGIPLNCFIYTTIINACSHNRYVDQAEALFLEMQRQGIHPDTTAWNALLNVFCKAGRLTKACMYFKKMESMGINQDIITYTKLLQTYAAVTDKDNGHDHLKAVYWLLDDSKKKDLRPNLRVYNAVIEVCNRADAIVEAFEVLSEMDNRRVEPDIQTYNLILDGLTREPNMKTKAVRSATERLRKRMKEGKLKWTLETYNALLQLCARTGNLERAELYFRWMKKAGYSPNRVSYISRLRIYQSCGDRSNKTQYLKSCFETAEEMVDAGYAMDGHAYADLIRACGNVGDIDRVKSVWKQLTKSGVTMDVSLATAIVEALLKGDAVDEALRFLHRIESYLFVRDAKICRLFLKYFSIKKMKEKTTMFLAEMEELGIETETRAR